MSSESASIALAIPARGAVLSGEERGVGDPLVPLHGFGGDHRTWDLCWLGAPAARHPIRFAGFWTVDSGCAGLLPAQRRPQSRA